MNSDIGWMCTRKIFLNYEYYLVIQNKLNACMNTEMKV